MGNLVRIWADVPEDGSLEEVRQAFRDVFGHDWDEVLITGGDASLLYRFWDGYAGVAGLRPHAGGAVAAIKAARRDVPVYDIVLG